MICLKTLSVLLALPEAISSSANNFLFDLMRLFASASLARQTWMTKVSAQTAGRHAPCLRLRRGELLAVLGADTRADWGCAERQESWVTLACYE
jgi:hypothetical protein